MKKGDIYYYRSHINEIDNVTLGEAMKILSDAQKEVEESAIKQGYVLDKVTFTTDGDNSSYGDDSYISMIATRYETDKEEKAREKKEKEISDKKEAEKKARELKKEADRKKQEALMEDPDYAFYVELQERLKRQGKL